MLSVAGVAGGGISPLTASRPRPAGAPFAQGTTLRPATSPVEGCRIGKGRSRPHGAAKCANCGAAHRAQADVCAFRREACQSARGWRPQPPPRRERGATGPPKALETETLVAQGGQGRGGPAQAAVEAGSRRLGDPIFSFSFVCPPVLVRLFLFLFLFLWSGEAGGKGIREPCYNRSFRFGTEFC